KCDTAQVAEADRENPGVAAGSRELYAFPVRGYFSPLVADPVSVHPYPDQRARFGLRVAEDTGEGESLLHVRLRQLVFAEPMREEAGPEEGFQAGRRLVVVRCECLFASVGPLAQMAVQIPEPHQRTRERELFGACVRAPKRVEGEPEVFVFCLERF